MAQLMLALLYLEKLGENLNRPDGAMRLIRGETSPELLADSDRAVEYCRAVNRAELPAGEEIRAAARAMLTVAEAMRAMLNPGGPSNLDFGGLMQAMGAMQKLVEEARSGAPSGFGSPASGMHTVFNAFAAATREPIDRLPAIVHGKDPAIAAPATPRRTPPAAAPVDLAELRDKLHSRFVELGGDDAAPDVRAAATTLLRPDAPAADQEGVDQLVAMASTVADGSDPADPLAAGTDQFLLAVALHLRNRAESTDGDAGADHEAGLECLLTAAGTVPAQDPASITVLGALGAFLDGQRPPHELMAGFVTPIDAVIRAGTVRREDDFAVLYALHCLCRTAGGDTGAVDLRRAVAGVPTDYPWLGHVRAAADVCLTTGQPVGAGEALA